MHILSESVISHTMNMTSTSFRQAHLLSLIEEAGSIEALSARLGMSPQYLSQLKNGTRGIGHRTARKIEKAAGLPEGAMDLPPVGDDVDAELDYLLSSVDEDAAIKAISEVVPRLSDESISKLTVALLSRLQPPEDAE